jgi:hypothetical protein
MSDVGMMRRTNGKANDAELTFVRHSGIPAFLFVKIVKNVNNFANNQLPVLPVFILLYHSGQYQNLETMFGYLWQK